MRSSAAFKKFFLYLWLPFLLACGSDPTLSEKRSQRVDENHEIVIGVVHSSDNLLLEGVKLAMNEVNRYGGIGRRPLKALFYNYDNSHEKERGIALELSRNVDVAAVVGHSAGYSPVSVSIIYDESGLLFISPWCTLPKLTRYGSPYVFRNINTDDVTGKKMVNFAHENNYKKTAVIFDAESAARRIAEAFHGNADKYGVKIVLEKPYFSWAEDFRSIISELKKKAEGIDSIFLAGELPAAARFISQLREMDVKVPVLGTPYLDSPEFLAMAGSAADNTFIPTVFHPKLPVAATANFVKNFKEEYHVMPDTWAAQGYDAVKILALAMQKNLSAAPMVTANNMRFLKNLEGVTGTYSFKQNGDIEEKTLYVKKVENGKFQFLPLPEQKINPRYIDVEKTLRIPLPRPITSLDPGKVSDSASLEIIDQLFLGLTTFTGQGQSVAPELAESWEVSDDGRIHTFHMRNDAVWTDGKPVSAEDVVFAVLRNLDPANTSESVRPLYFLKNAESFHKGNVADASQVGVRAAARHVVEFELEDPMVFFPMLTALPVYYPLPGHIIEALGDDEWCEPENIRTNGPYKLIKRFRDKMLILKKNELYFHEKNVSIPEIRYFILRDRFVAASMFSAGQLDVIGGEYYPVAAARMSENVQSRANVRQFQEPLFSTYGYAFNTKRSPADDPIVRKAVASAVNKELITNFIAEKGRIPAILFSPPSVLNVGKRHEDMGIPFNPALAGSLLAQAGYPGGKGFPGILLMHGGARRDEKIAVAVKDMLEHALNIAVSLQPCDDSDLSACIDKYRPHIFLLDQHALYPDAHNFLNDPFNPATFPNYTGWSNSEFEKLVRRAENVADPIERNELYKKAELILCKKECVVIPVFHGTAGYFMQNRVKGWRSPGFGSRAVENLYLESH